MTHTSAYGSISLKGPRCDANLKGPTLRDEQNRITVDEILIDIYYAILNQAVRERMVSTLPLPLILHSRHRTSVDNLINHLTDLLSLCPDEPAANVHAAAAPLAIIVLRHASAIRESSNPQLAIALMQAYAKTLDAYSYGASSTRRVTSNLLWLWSIATSPRQH